MINKMLGTAAAAAAILTLGLLTSTASAGRLSSSANAFRMTWAPVTFASEAEGQGVTIRCNLTLEGSFHYRTIIKQPRSLIGYVTKAVTGHPGCSGGEAWDLNGVEVVLGSTTPNTLPWHVTYEGFEGTLPSISGIRFLVRPQFMINVIGILCLYEGNVQGVVKLTRGVGASTVPDATVGTTKKSGGIFCGASGFFSLEVGATSTLTVLGSGSGITITLI